MEGTVFTPRCVQHRNEPRRLYHVNAKTDWVSMKRAKAVKQLVKHKKACKEWRKANSRGRPRLKMMYQIGLQCSQAKTSVNQSDWVSDLRVANKSGEHKTPDYKPNIRFSQTYFGTHTAHNAAVWKNEVSNLCRGK